MLLLIPEIFMQIGIVTIFGILIKNVNLKK
jgi:hypothetical protein